MSKSLKKFLLIFTSYLIIAISSLFYYSVVTKERISNEFILQSQIELTNLNTLIEAEYVDLESQVHFLTQMTNSVLNDNASYLEPLEELFRNFINYHPNNFQIRLLSTSGVELLKVIREENGSIQTVQSSELQDKSKRYYFKELTALDSHDIMYCSVVDLNIENGEIEIPYRPTTRAGLKLETTKTHPELGYFIINHNIKHLIDKLKASTFALVGDLILIDQEGYFVSNSNAELEWGKDLNHPEYNFYSMHHQGEKLVDSYGNFSNEQGVFTYQRLNFCNQNYYLVIHKSAAAFEEVHDEKMEIPLIIAGIITLLILVL